MSRALVLALAVGVAGCGGLDLNRLATDLDAVNGCLIALAEDAVAIQADPAIWVLQHEKVTAAGVVKALQGVKDSGLAAATLVACQPLISALAKYKEKKPPTP